MFFNFEKKFFPKNAEILIIYLKKFFPKNAEILIIYLKIKFL